jgi:hypothetical protein
MAWLVVGDDAQFHGNGRRSVPMVAGDHHRTHAGLPALLDGRLHSGRTKGRSYR